MKLSNITIIPDCIGNRSFCFDGVNCFMPNYNLDDLTATAHKAISLINEKSISDIKKSASKTIQGHTLMREQKQFYKLLGELPYAF